MTVRMVVIAKTRERMRVMNSRSAITRINRWLFIDSLATHDVAEQLRQCRPIAPELVHWADGQRLLKHGLLTGGVVELNEPSRAVLLDERPPRDADVPACHRAGDVHPEAQRSALSEFVDGPGGDHLPVVDDADAIAEPLNDVELVARDHDRSSLVRLRAQHLRHRIDCHRIEAGERFVEYQQLW